MNELVVAVEEGLVTPSIPNCIVPAVKPDVNPPVIYKIFEATSHCAVLDGPVSIYWHVPADLVVIETVGGKTTEIAAPAGRLFVILKVK